MATRNRQRTRRSATVSLSMADSGAARAEARPAFGSGQSAAGGAAVSPPHPAARNSAARTLQ
jgi:hypothetical protein